MRIIHVITSLSSDGAQTMLYKLLSSLDRSLYQSQVISLTDRGAMASKIEALGVPVLALGMRPGMPSPVSILQLAAWFRRYAPNVIQTWLYHADLIGGIAAKLAGGIPVAWNIRREIPVAWNIRHGTIDSKGHKKSTVLAVKACAVLSRWLPIRIVCCSESSRLAHSAIGYQGHEMLVIPNGFDLSGFRPDPGARLSVRQELGLPEDAVIIGLIARFHPLKDHRNFISAAALLHTKYPEVHFLLCGAGATAENSELAEWIKATNVAERIHLLGHRQDVSRVDAALDIASSSSYSEGFPNAIGEAMACAVPCAVTDAGESALIVGDTGRVVPPKDPAALASAWTELIEMGRGGRSLLGHAARDRISQYFSLHTIVERYASLYKNIEARAVQGSPPVTAPK
jgi:glycosyltransferase involved in cell wall biosynthesis